MGILDKFKDLEALDDYLINSGNSDYFKFNDESIDFDQVGCKYRNKHGPPHSFGLTKLQQFKIFLSDILIIRCDCEKVFLMVRSLIIDNRIKKDSFAIIGLKQYIEKEIKNIRKKCYLFGIPIYSFSFVFSWPNEKKFISIVVDSIILTILNKPNATFDSVNGFSHVCRWIAEDLPINPTENEFIKIINQELIE